MCDTATIYDLYSKSFVGERKDRIATIQAAFPDVYYKSYGFWEDGFRRDTNPDKDLGI